MPDDLLDCHRRIENGQLGQQQNRRSSRHPRDLRQNRELLAQVGIAADDHRSGLLDLLDPFFDLGDVRLDVTDDSPADCSHVLCVKAVLLFRSCVNQFTQPSSELA